MNYNKRCYNDFDCEDNQTSYANFPEDWNFGEDSRDDDRGFYGNQRNYRQGNKKCFYGQFIVCEKGNGNNNGSRPNKCRCHDDRDNSDWQYDKINCHSRGCNGNQNRSCNCPICNFFRRFHC